MEALKIIRADVNHIDLAIDAIQNIHKREGASVASLRAFLQSPENILLLACSDKKVIGSLNGYSLLHPDQLAPQFLLYEVDVLLLFRNRGVGKSLVTAFVALARHSGAFEVWVLTNASNETATKMYLKCGFQQKNKDDVMLSIDVTKIKTTIGELGLKYLL
jgi:ribosomal protein S18 acetylase RimI-like enzyme